MKNQLVVFTVFMILTACGQIVGPMHPDDFPLSAVTTPIEPGVPVADPPAITLPHETRDAGTAVPDTGVVPGAEAGVVSTDSATESEDTSPMADATPETFPADASAENDVATVPQNGAVDVLCSDPESSYTYTNTYGFTARRISFQTHDRAVDVVSVTAEIRGVSPAGIPRRHVESQSGLRYFRNTRLMRDTTGMTLMGPSELTSVSTDRASALIPFTRAFTVSEGARMDLSIKTDTAAHEVVQDEYVHGQYAVTLASDGLVLRYIDGSLVPSESIHMDSSCTRVMPSTVFNIKPRYADINVNILPLVGFERNVTVTEVAEAVYLLPLSIANCGREDGLLDTVTMEVVVRSASGTRLALNRVASRCALTSDDRRTVYGETPVASSNLIQFRNTRAPIPGSHLVTMASGGVGYACGMRFLHLLCDVRWPEATNDAWIDARAGALAVIGENGYYRAEGLSMISLGDEGVIGASAEFLENGRWPQPIGRSLLAVTIRRAMVP